MNERIYTKKSLDKIKSVDSLNDYIRVSNPAVWLLLVAVISILVGIFIWGIFGTVESTLEVAAHVENGKVVCFVNETDIGRIEEGMAVRIGKTNGTVLEIGSFDYGTRTYPVMSEADLSDGVYVAEIVIESLKPVSFILN